MAVIAVIAILSVLAVFYIQKQIPTQQTILLTKDLTRVLSTVRVSQFDFSKYNYTDTLYLGIINRTDEDPRRIEVLVGRVHNVSVATPASATEIDAMIPQMVVGDKRVKVFMDPVLNVTKFLIDPLIADEVVTGSTADGVPFINLSNVGLGFQNVDRGPNFYLPVTPSAGLYFKRYLDDPIIVGGQSIPVRRLELIEGDFAVLRVNDAGTVSQEIGGTLLVYNLTGPAQTEGRLQVNMQHGSNALPYTLPLWQFGYAGNTYTQSMYVGNPLPSPDSRGFWPINPTTPSEYMLMFDKFTFDVQRELVRTGQYRSDATILELFGTLYAVGERSLVRQLTAQMLDAFIPGQFGYSMTFDGDVLAERRRDPVRNLFTTKHLVTGIQQGADSLGSSATVFLRDISSADSSYLYFGGYVGDGVIAKRIVLPEAYQTGYFVESVYIEADTGNSFEINVSNAVTPHTNVLTYRKPTANTSFVMRHHILRSEQKREMVVIGVYPLNHPDVTCQTNHVTAGVAQTSDSSCVFLLLGFEDIGYHRQALGDIDSGNEWEKSLGGVLFKIGALDPAPGTSEVQFKVHQGLSQYNLNIRQGEFGTFSHNEVKYGIFLREYDPAASKVDYLIGIVMNRTMDIADRSNPNVPISYIASTQEDEPWIQVNQVRPNAFSSSRAARAQLSIEGREIYVHPLTLITLVPGVWTDADSTGKSLYNINKIFPGENLFLFDFSNSPGFGVVGPRNQYVAGGMLRVNYRSPTTQFEGIDDERSNTFELAQIRSQDSINPFKPISGVYDPTINQFTSMDVPGVLLDLVVHLKYHRLREDLGNLFLSIGDTVVYTSVDPSTGALRLPGTNTLPGLSENKEIVVNKGPIGAKTWEEVTVDIRLTNYSAGELPNPLIPSGKINFSEISDLTIPLRIGFKEVRKVDIALVTDLSNSMAECVSYPQTISETPTYQGAPAVYESDPEMYGLSKNLLFSSQWDRWFGMTTQWWSPQDPNVLVYRENFGAADVGLPIFFTPRHSVSDDWKDYDIELNLTIAGPAQGTADFGIILRHTNSTPDNHKFYMVQYLRNMANGQGTVTFNHVILDGNTMTMVPLSFRNEIDSVTFSQPAGTMYWWVSADEDSFYVKFRDTNGLHHNFSVFDSLEPRGDIGLFADASVASTTMEIANLTWLASRARIFPEQSCGGTLFYDNFNNELVSMNETSYGKWNVTTSGKWSANVWKTMVLPFSIGYAKTAMSNKTNAHMELPQRDDQSWVNYTLYFDLRYIHHDLGIQLYRSDYGTYYEVLLHDNIGSTGIPTVRVQKLLNGVPTLLGEQRASTFSSIPKGRYAARVSSDARQAVIEFYGPGHVLLGRFNDSENPLLPGKIAFFTDGTPHLGVSLDNVMVASGNAYLSSDFSVSCHDLGYCQILEDSRMDGIRYNLNPTPQPVGHKSCDLDGPSGSQSPLSCSDVQASYYCNPGSAGACNYYGGNPTQLCGGWSVIGPPPSWNPVCCSNPSSAPSSNCYYGTDPTYCAPDQVYTNWEVSPMPNQCNERQMACENTYRCRSEAMGYTNFGSQVAAALPYYPGPCPEGNPNPPINITLAWNQVLSNSPGALKSLPHCITETNAPGAETPHKLMHRIGIGITLEMPRHGIMYEYYGFEDKATAKKNPFIVANKYCEDVRSVPVSGSGIYTLCSGNCKVPQIDKCSVAYTFIPTNSATRRYPCKTALDSAECDLVYPEDEGYMCYYDGSAGNLYTPSSASGQVLLDQGSALHTSLNALMDAKCKPLGGILDIHVGFYPNISFSQPPAILCDNAHPDPSRHCNSPESETAACLIMVGAIQQNPNPPPGYSHMFWLDTDPALSTYLGTPNYAVIRHGASNLVNVYRMFGTFNYESKYNIIGADDDAQLTPFQFEQKCREIRLGQEKYLVTLPVSDFSGVRKVCDNSAPSTCPAENPDGNCKCEDTSPDLDRCEAYFRKISVSGETISSYVYPGGVPLTTCAGIENTPYLSSFEDSMNTKRHYCQCFATGGEGTQCFVWEITWPSIPASSNNQELTGFSRVRRQQRHFYQLYRTIEEYWRINAQTIGSGTNTRDWVNCFQWQNASTAYECSSSFADISGDVAAFWKPKPPVHDYNWDGKSVYGSRTYYNTFIIPSGVTVQELTVGINRDGAVKCWINNVPVIEEVSVSGTSNLVRTIITGRDTPLFDSYPNQADLDGLALRYGPATPNEIICRVRSGSYLQDPNFQLVLAAQFVNDGVLDADETVLIGTNNPDWKMFTQNVFCGPGTANYPNCEYGVLTDSCEGTYPFDVGTPRRDIAWVTFATQDVDEVSMLYTDYVLDIVLPEIARALGGEIITHVNGTPIPRVVYTPDLDLVGGSAADPFMNDKSIIPEGFWNETNPAQVLFVRFNAMTYSMNYPQTVEYFNKRIATALLAGKTVFVEHAAIDKNSFEAYFSDPRLGNLEPNVFDIPSYSMGSQIVYAFDTYHADGSLLGRRNLFHSAGMSTEYDTLWGTDSPIRNPNGYYDDFSWFSSVLYPVFNRTQDHNTCHPQYCIPPAGSATCEICPATRIKLAKKLDKDFVQTIYEKEAGEVLLVTYGSNATGFCELQVGEPDTACKDFSWPSDGATDKARYYSLADASTRDQNRETLFRAIDRFEETRGETCISCAVRKAVNALLYKEFDQNNGVWVPFGHSDINRFHNKAVLLMTDGIANRCLVPSCEYGQADLAGTKEVQDLYLAGGWYTIDMSQVGFSWDDYPGIEIGQRATVIGRECKLISDVWACMNRTQVSDIATGTIIDTFDSIYCSDDLLTPLNDIYTACRTTDIDQGGVTFTQCAPSDTLCPAKREAIYQACYYGVSKANEQGMQLRMYTVDLGTGADDKEQTLKRIAECTGGAYFRSDNAQELARVYNNIAEEIFFASQSLENVEVLSTLEEGTIRAVYAPTQDVATEFGEIPLTFETDPFSLSDFGRAGPPPYTGPYYYSEAELSIPSHLRLKSAHILSYSTSNWTAYVYQSNESAFTISQPSLVFNLSSFLIGDLSTFLAVGDPFIVRLKVRNSTQDLLDTGNNKVYLAMLSDPADYSHPGGMNSRIIYTLLLSTVTGSPSFAPRSLGCFWIISFEGGQSAVWGIPQSPLPPSTDICDYKKLLVCHDGDALDISKWDTTTRDTYCSAYGVIPVDNTIPPLIKQDAINYAVYTLLKRLDLDTQGLRDGNIDIDFSISDLVLQLNPNTVPYLIGPAEMEIRVWN